MKAPQLLDDPRLDLDLLRNFGFDEGTFRTHAQHIAEGTLNEDTAIIRGAIAPARDAAIPVDWESDQAARAREAGSVALSRGEVATLVVNGGMATRFGGVVKGVVEVLDGESFLSLKAMDTRRKVATFGGRIPFIIMNSFATDLATRAHIEAKDRFHVPKDDLLVFVQSISIRLNPDGTLFIGKDGLPSYYAPGHGDFFSAIKRSGTLARLEERGVRVLMFSNVDNLGATVDPVIIGHHLLSGAHMTVEVTEKRRTATGAWETGGAPAMVDGRLQIVEGFRFPKEFAQQSLPDFSTNNMLFSLEGLAGEILLPQHVVRKVVDGHPVLQLESITCEASGLFDAAGRRMLPLTLLRVPREGPHGRFYPVKEPTDLAAVRKRIQASGLRL